jgi:hypothetical protein
MRILFGLIFACTAMAGNPAVGACTAGDCDVDSTLSVGSARDLGVDFNWQLVVVPGADHDNGNMAIGAAPLIP